VADDLEALRITAGDDAQLGITFDQSVATSITVTGWSNCLWLPSGSVMAGMAWSLLQKSYSRIQKKAQSAL
jgi:hypothetical protein